MSENANSVVVSDHHLMEFWSIYLLVDTILIINASLWGKFLDDPNCFFSNSCLSLLCACTNVVRAIDSWMLSERMGESNFFSASRLSIVHICSEPEVLICLKMSKKMLFIHNCASGSVNENCILLHMGKEIAVHHILCVSGSWSVDTHNIAVCEKLMKRWSILKAKLLVQSWVLSASVDKDIHIEGLSSFMHQLSDVSEPYQTKSATFNASAVCEHSLVPFLFLEKLHSFWNASVDR